MDTLAHADITLILDRGVRKVRVNMFKDGKLVGFLKPISSFGVSNSSWEGMG